MPDRNDSEKSFGVALASACGETHTPFCMNGFVGDGDLDVEFGLLRMPCMVRCGEDGLVKPRRRLDDWSRRTPTIGLEPYGYRFS